LGRREHECSSVPACYRRHLLDRPAEINHTWWEFRSAAEGTQCKQRSIVGKARREMCCRSVSSQRRSRDRVKYESNCARPASTPPIGKFAGADSAEVCPHRWL